VFKFEYAEIASRDVLLPMPIRIRESCKFESLYLLRRVPHIRECEAERIVDPGVDLIEVSSIRRLVIALLMNLSQQK
jgi:hypothetical protein